jgi:glucose/arabinose dehydrogenase
MSPGPAPRLRLALTAALVALGIACLCALLAGRAQALHLSQIGSFQEPTYVDDAPGKKNRKLLFVTQKAGLVIALRNGVPLPAPFLDISDLVSAPRGSEQGLFSIAFHPEYERNRLFYVFFTDRNGDNVLYEFRRRRKSRVQALRSSGRQVLLIPHPDDASNHNGGQIAFGPKNLLYLGTGDGGSTPATPQDPNLVTGKLLRIDPRVQVPRRRHGKGKAKKAATARYGIPRGNPFVGGPGRDEIYALGLRNPYRLSFDRGTGALTIGDVGASLREEIEYRNAGSIRAVNFGWPRFEGTVLANPSVQAPGAVGPTLDYPHTNGRCAVIGGYVVRDRHLAGINGRYVYGDLCSGELRSLIPSQGPAVGDAPLGVPDVSSVDSFGEGRGGAIYVLSLEGPVYRLNP